eukprot:734816-Prymnesium_polylepis.1
MCVGGATLQETNSCTPLQISATRCPEPRPPVWTQGTRSQPQQLTNNRPPQPRQLGGGGQTVRARAHRRATPHTAR